MHSFTQIHQHVHSICSMGGVLKHCIPSCCSSLVCGRGMWEEGSGAMTGGAVTLDVSVLFAQVGHLRSHGVKLLHLLITTVLNEPIKWERNLNEICNIISLWEQTDRKHDCFWVLWGQRRDILRFQSAITDEHRSSTLHIAEIFYLSTYIILYFQVDFNTASQIQYRWESVPWEKQSFKPVITLR